MNKQTIRDINVASQIVLVRASLNVPIATDKVGDRLRLEAALPTLRYLLERSARIVLLSHHSKAGQSLAPVAPVLAELLDQPVRFVADCVGLLAQAAVAALPPRGIALLENVRFHIGEEANDPSFAKQLAALGNVYVEDDFTVTHRRHASVVGVPKLLPAVAGLQVEREVTTITAALESPHRPLLAVVSGAKISTKIPILDNLLPKVDVALVGGAMANTFLLAEGREVGKSLVEPGQVALAKQIIKTAATQGVKLFLPIDVVVSGNLQGTGTSRTVPVDAVGPDDIIVDVGRQTVAQLDEILSRHGTVIWNGPLGITEVPAFTGGSLALAEAIIVSGSASIVGGGDTAAFIDNAGLKDKFSFVSTGGGAALELMAGNELPGIAALLDK